LESTVNASTTYNPTKSFLYNINPRGLDWFMNPMIAPSSAYDQLQVMGYTPGVGSFGNFVVVPSNLQDLIPKPKQFSIATSQRSTKRRNASSSSSVVVVATPPPRPGYWIPRHQMNEILSNCCHEHNANMETITTINVNTGKTVIALYPNSTIDTNLVSVQCQDGSIYTGSLIVAADGINSVVRSCLAGLSPHTHPSSWLQSKASFFRVKKYKSPSTGLKFKALQLTPNFKMPNITTPSDKVHHDATANQYYVPQSTDLISIRGVQNGFRNRLSLGLLPMKDPNMIRLGNTIAPYDHEIWSLQNGTDAKLWFTRNFPRMLWNTSLIDENEWDRYVQSNSTTFPYCQHSPASAISSPKALCGVVMVGDACK
jgi:kynurenine 3-monooxygenase